MAEYKIELGVLLNTNNVQTQINNIKTNPINLDVKLDIEKAKSQINNLRNQIQQLGNIKINLGGTGATNGNAGTKKVVNDMNWAYKQMLSIQKKANSMSLRINSLDTSKNVNELKELSLQFARLRSDYETLRKAFGGQLSTAQWGNLQAELDETSAKLSAMDSKIADTKAKLASEIKLKLSDGTFANDISNIETKFNNLSSQSVELKAKIDKVKQALQAMEAAASGNNSDRLISASERYKKALKDVENQLRINARAEKADDNSYILENKKSAMLAEVNQWLKENSKAAKMFGAEIKQVQNALLNCKTGAQFKNISSDFNRIKKEAKDAGVATQTFTDKLSKQFERYKNYFSVASMFMYATMGLKDMFRQVVSIDTAMTELKKVTDETNASYNKFLTNAADKAKEIGTTIDGLVSSTADFARLGYDFADAQGLAQVANIYAVVGDEINGVEGATESLVSTLAAFKHEMNGMDDADFALSIVDKFNEVSNNFAISSGGIGEALKRSASSMAAANNTLDETIALITAANTVVQDPDRVGNAFKTVSMRIRGAKTELEEAGLETEGMVESTAKLRQEIMALSGVDIMLNENTFKSTYQIMDELSQKWESLSDIAQASIIELIAGKHQGNVVQSLMSNFDIAREALETSMNSAGSAMKEHEKWQESLEARINKLKAAWQGLSQAFMSSDFLKVVISSVTTLVDWLTKLIDTIGTLPTLLGAFAGFKILLTLLKSGGLSGGLKGLFGLKDILSLLSLAFPNTANGATKLISAFKGLSSTGGATGGVLTKLFGLLKNPYVAIATIAVTALTAAFMHQKKEAKELAEEVEKTVSSYKDQHGELIKLKNDYDTSNEDSMISKYKELSKGVNDLGENMALTSDEYMEYQSIVNTIAEQIPSLVSGYDEQGNAILSCKGNVDQLTDAYQRLIHAQNQDILTKAGNIEQDFENTIKEAEKGSFLGIGDKVSTPSIELLEEILNGDYSKREITNLLNNAKTSTVDGIYEALKDAGIGDLGSSWSNGEIADVLSKQLKSDPSKIKSVVKDYFTQFNEAVEEQKTIAKAKLSDAFDVSSAITEGTDYSNISETLQNIAEQTVNNLDYDFFANLKKQGRTVEQWTTEMLDQLNSISESNVGKIEAAFDLQTKFNGGEISYGEYVKGVEDVGALVDKLGLNQEITSQIKLNLGLSESTVKDGKWVVKEYENLLNRLTSEEYEIQLSDEKARSLLDELTASEYEVLVDLVMSGEVDLGNFDINSLRAYIEKQAKINEAMNFKIDMAVETSGLEAFNAAMAESVSGVGLTSESISALKGRYSELASQGYDLSAMFEETANGIHLNRKAVDELEQTLASQKLEETEGHLDVLKQTYDELTEEIKNCTDAGERANLYTEQQEIARKINDLATLASQYEGLTSAYNAWQNAESAGSERDMYENVITGFKTMDDEISRGWIDDSSIAFLELLTGRTDLAVASTEELKNAYKGLSKDINSAGYSIRDFFTVDADGNSTNTGVYNFLETVEAQYKGIEDVIKKNAEGEIIGFDFNVLAKEDENGNFINGDKVIAEALGISEEVVQIMLRAADDAGFVVTLDGKWTQLADLKDYAQNASNELKLLKENSEFLKDISDEDLNFNFNANNLSDLNSEFEKAYNVLEKFKNEDGTIKVDENGNLVEGAQQALDIATYYQAAVDKLTEPAYMQLDASQVEENLRDPLAKMQEFQDLVKTKHQLVLEGKSLEETEAKMTEIAEYLQGLGEEQKIGLGIDPSLSTEEIKSKLEKGEIEIPATVDLQVEMSEELKDIKLLMMKQLGLVEGEEVTLKVGYDIDDSVVDTLTDKEMKVVVKYIEENKKWFDGLTSEEQEIAVKLIANGEVDTSIIDKKIEEELNSKENAGETEVSTDVTVDANNVDTTGVEEAVNDKLENGMGGFSSAETYTDVDVNADNVDVSNVEESVVDKLNNYTPLLENVVTDADIEVKAFAKIFGVEEVDDLKLKLDGLTDEQIVIFTQVLGQMDVEKLKTTISGLDDETVQIIAEAIGTGDVETLKNTINGLDSKTVQAIAEAFGFADVTELNSAIENLDPKTVQAIAQALGIKDVNSLRDAIERLKGKDVKAVANVKGKKEVDGLKSSINALKGKTITVWAQIKKKASDLWGKLTGGGGVDGTAHVSGTAYSDGTTNKNTIKNSGRAFKQGDWGTKDSGVALGAELGPELLVRNGKWHLIGEDGAQFFGYRKGDIIFNADQTREIFEKGKITHGNGRGKALVSGTAFSSGTGGFGKVNGNTVSVEADTVNVNSNKTTTSSSSDTKKETSSDSKESAEEFEESIDWIEIAIDRLERSIGQLDTKANSAYRSWEERNGAIVEQIGKTREEIELQQKAYERYMQEAANVGLSSDWIAKIQNGSIDIETITDEELADKISQYQEWFEKALDCKDAIIELQEAESELYKQRFDNVLAQYEGMLSIIEHEKNMLDEFVAQSEAQGWLISENYYNALIGNEQKQIAKLQEEKSALLSELQTAMQSGKIAKGSEAW